MSAGGVWPDQPRLGLHGRKRCPTETREHNGTGSIVRWRLRKLPAAFAANRAAGAQETVAYFAHQVPPVHPQL